MDAAEGLQLPRIKTLSAQGHAIHAGAAVFGESSALHRARIRLKRDFCIGCDMQMPTRGAEHPCDAVRGEKTGCAAAQKHTHDRARTGLRALESKIALQSLDVWRLGKVSVQRVRIEVAV